MSTTQTVLACSLMKGPHSGGSLYAFEVVVKVAGTYAHASAPNIDFLAAIQAQHQGISAVGVKSAIAWQDGDANSVPLGAVTVPNSEIALSSTGNKVITFDLDTGAANGDDGTEVVDAVVVSAIVSLLVVTTLTPTL